MDVFYELCDTYCGNTPLLATMDEQLTGDPSQGVTEHLTWKAIAVQASHCISKLLGVCCECCSSSFIFGVSKRIGSDKSSSSAKALTAKRRKAKIPGPREAAIFATLQVQCLTIDSGTKGSVTRNRSSTDNNPTVTNLLSMKIKT